MEHHPRKQCGGWQKEVESLRERDVVMKQERILDWHRCWSPRLTPLTPLFCTCNNGYCAPLNFAIPKLGFFPTCLFELPCHESFLGLSYYCLGWFFLLLKHYNSLESLHCRHSNIDAEFEINSTSSLPNVLFSEKMFYLVQRRAYQRKLLEGGQQFQKSRNCSYNSQIRRELFWTI